MIPVVPRINETIYIYITTLDTSPMNRLQIIDALKKSEKSNSISESLDKTSDKDKTFYHESMGSIRAIYKQDLKTSVGQFGISVIQSHYEIYIRYNAKYNKLHDYSEKSTIEAYKNIYIYYPKRGKYIEVRSIIFENKLRRILFIGKELS